jgi:acetolactate synthase I/II/III large subunit
MEQYVQAEACLEVMNSYGVEYIFFNPGIDTVPFQVAISRFKATGKKTPGLILCLDEAVAMAAAHGHYMVSGRPQVVLVHSELGTLQVGGAMTNAQRGRIPVVLTAGVQPSPRRETWRKEPYDQGSIVRNCVKWDYEVKAGENVADALNQVMQVALSGPCGPVYLATPIQTLFSNTGEICVPAAAAPAPAKKAETAGLEKAAEILMSAASPLIMAGQSGRHAGSVAALVKLAETLSARVISGPVRMNFPTTHPLCAGIDPISGGTRGIGRYISETDALLLIDYDLPYAAGPVAPPPGASVIYIDLDPAKRTVPLWDHPAEVFLEADSREAIPALQNLIERKLTPEHRRIYKERFIEIEYANLQQRLERKTQAKNQAGRSPISADWLAYCLAQAVDEDTLILNQTITHSSSVVEQIERTLPGSFLACAGGSIGWPLGAALGAKLAAPDKTVVSLMGDGAYIWGCPTATLWTARSYHAPFLAVIFNNQAYAAIKGLVQRAYGDEKLSADKGFAAGVDIVAPPDYSMIARACGAFGTSVRDPQEVLPVLKEALEHVRQGQPAVVDVRLA